MTHRSPTGRRQATTGYRQATDRLPTGYRQATDRLPIGDISRIKVQNETSTER